MARRLVPLLCGVAIVFAGCVQPDLGLEEAGGLARERGAAAVVAVVDLGINPYHDAFAAAPGAEDAVAFAKRWGIDAIPVRLSSHGSWDERLEADANAWGELEPFTLYAFEGTRLFGYAQHPGTDPFLADPLLMEGRGGKGHGTTTAFQITQAAASAFVVMVQVDGSYCLEEDQGRCIAKPSMAEGVAWAASQPWVDVVSMSWGAQANTPRAQAWFEDQRLLVHATRSAVASGKLVTVAAGATPSAVMFDNTDGPPWVLAVGGWHPYQNGPVAMSPRGVDVLANVTAQVASSNSTSGWFWSMGTSLAAPTVAGAIAETVARVREAVGHDGPILDAALAVGRNGERFTNADIRSALNASAWVPPLGTWNPTQARAHKNATSPLSAAAFMAYEAASPNLAPEANLGWGVVDGRIHEEMVRRVLEKDFAVPEAKARHAELRAQHQAAREAYWSTGGV